MFYMFAITMFIISVYNYVVFNFDTTQLYSISLSDKV